MRLASVSFVRGGCGLTGPLEPQTGAARNGETVLHMKDRLPKFKDFPKAFGGSGIELPE